MYLCLLFGCLCLYLYVRWSALWASILSSTYAPQGPTVLSVCLIFSETIVTVIGIINISVLILGTVHNTYRKADRERKRQSIEDQEDTHCPLPTVAIFIPTYREDAIILRRTLLAVSRLWYPLEKLTVVIGDDGNRDEIQQMVEREFPMVAYHRRTSIRGHAKAGNINDMLFAKTEGEFQYDADFFLILDCDMAPHPWMLNRLVPPFYGAANVDDVCIQKDCPLLGRRIPNIAFVQSPQSFVNIDVPDFLGQHYTFFYHVVLPAYNGFGQGVPCCGTNAVFDTKILRSIGGLQYGSITEDFLTSMALHARGFKSAYVTQETALGYAPETLVDFYQQRKRWTIGGLQILFGKGMRQHFRALRAVYKWIYVFSGAAPFVSLFLLALIVGPLLDLVFPNAFLLGLSSSTYAKLFLPYTALYLSGVLYLHRNLSFWSIILSIQETIFMVPYTLSFIVSFLLSSCNHRAVISFKTTPKPFTDPTAILTAKPLTAGELIMCFSLLLPYMAFYFLAATCVAIAYRAHGQSWAAVPAVDLGWMVALCFQMLNPMAFHLQSCLKTT